MHRGKAGSHTDPILYAGGTTLYVHLQVTVEADDLHYSV